MGISFKVAKTGTRFRPRPVQSEIFGENAGDDSKESVQSQVGTRLIGNKRKLSEAGLNKVRDDINGCTVSSTSCGGPSVSSEHEVSFSLNLFPNGFSIGKPTEKGKFHPLLQDVPESVHPYGRASETLFSAIESGRLPGDILENAPGKYHNGSLVCEVRDYRKCMSRLGNSVSAADGFPVVIKVRLQMSLENIVRDIPSISNDSWTYGDLMEVESRILKALQPKLCLDPTPMLDRLCCTPISNKLDLGICGRKKRLREIPEVNAMSNSLSHGKKISIDRLSKNMKSKPGPTLRDAAIEQEGIPGAAWRDEEGITSQVISSNLRPKSVGRESPRQAVSLVSQPKFQPANVYPRNIHDHRCASVPSNASAVATNCVSSCLGQRGIGYRMKEEQNETDNLDKEEIGKIKNEQGVVEIDTNQPDQQQLQQSRMPQQPFMRSHFLHQTHWQNLGPFSEKDPKEDFSQRKQTAQNPWVTAGALVQSPVSSKSGEFSCNSFGANHSTATTNSTVGLQQEKAAIALGAAGGAHQALKWKSNSVRKTPTTGGIGSPASVSNISTPFSANSPSVGTPPVPLPGNKTNQDVLERLSKIEVVTQRHHLNCRSKKADEYLERKPETNYATQLLSISNCLSNAFNTEDFKNSRDPLAKSLLGGSPNLSKIRILNFVRTERFFQGNGASVIVPRAQNRLVVSERASDGMVAMQYGYKEDCDFLAIEQDYLPTLPNTKFADLLAAQFSSLMSRDGYKLVDDQIQPAPAYNNSVSDLPYLQNTLGQSLSADVPVNSSLSPLNPLKFSPQNVLASTQMLPPDNIRSPQLPLGPVQGSLHLSSNQQLPNNPQSHIQPQQNLRSSMLTPTNSLSQLNTVGPSPNLQMGNHMVGRQVPLLQQQWQQQQQQQSKIMAGLGPAMSNNLVSLGGMSNAISIGGIGGMARGISSPVGPLSGLGPNQINLDQASRISNMINQQLRAGTITKAQAVAAMTASKLRMMQSQVGMVGPQLIRSQTDGLAVGPGGMSMLGQGLNRGNVVPLQRTVMPMSMGPAKVSGTSVYMSQQQQQLQLQQQQQQRQQMSQQTPMSPPRQVSSGGGHQMNGSNAGAGPTSPQLSSQTLGSVGSIASSPMELQGVNKS